MVMLKDKLKTITKASMKTEFRCGLATMNDDARYYAIGPGDCKTDKDFQNAILASSAMPIIWAPVRQLTKADGTVIKNILDGGMCPMGLNQAEDDYGDKGCNGDHIQ